MKRAKSVQEVEIPLGSIWQDQDPRMFRFVVVFGMPSLGSKNRDAGKIQVRNTEPPSGLRQPTGTADAPVGRESAVSAESFLKRFKRVS